MTDPAAQVPLAQALRRAAAGLREEAPPPQLLDRVHDALAASRAAAWRSAPVRRRGRGRGARGWTLLAFATAALAAFFVAPQRWPQADPDAEAREAWASGFVPLADRERWQRAASGQLGPVWLVSTEMPRERLAMLGLPYDPSRAGERVPAQLLMHASGDVLAVRVIQ
ncbi:MAG: hypothetical protein AB1430_08950 [Pseudomonadota bacterium]